MPAKVIRDRHTRLRAEDPSLGPLPDEAFVGIVYAVRQLACDALDNEPDPDLLALIEPATRWIAASINGAASVDLDGVTGGSGNGDRGA